jgi:hypothetical protein
MVRAALLDVTRHNRGSRAFLQSPTHNEMFFAVLLRNAPAGGVNRRLGVHLSEVETLPGVLVPAICKVGKWLAR